jgi:hypothetical protein
LSKHKNPAPHDPVRKAQLVAAGYALAAWVHERRATWPETDFEPVPEMQPVAAVPPVFSPEPPAAPPPPAAWAAAPPVPAQTWAAPPPVPAETRPSVPAPALEQWVAPVAADVPELVAEAPEPKAPLIPIAALRSLRAPILRFGSIAAGIALVVGVAWAALPYVSSLSKMVATPASGTAVFESVPPSEVSVDGVSVGTAPLTAELPSGHHVVEFRRRGVVRTIEIDVVGGRSTIARLDWDAVQMGTLTATSDPPGARVLVDGKDRGVTPLTLDDVPVGSHTVLLQSDQGSVRRTVMVTADNVVAVNEQIFAGWFKLFAPFAIQISEGARPIRLDDQGQTMLPAGPHELTFENSALGYRETKRVEVQPGETTSLSLVVPPSALTVLSNVAAIVAIDGAQVGETPLTNHPIALGTRDIIITNAAGEERRFTRTVTVAPVSIDVNF